MRCLQTGRKVGDYRVILHGISGVISGNASGGIGALASAKIIPELAKQLDSMGLKNTAMKRALLITAGAGIGNIVNGTTGGINTAGQVSNNFLSHQDKLELLKAEKALIQCRESSDCSDGKVEGYQKTIQYYSQLDLRTDSELLNSCTADPTGNQCRGSIKSAFHGVGLVRPYLR